MLFGPSSVATAEARSLKVPTSLHAEETHVTLSSRRLRSVGSRRKKREKKSSIDRPPTGSRTLSQSTHFLGNLGPRSTAVIHLVTGILALLLHGVHCDDGCSCSMN